MATILVGVLLLVSALIAVFVLYRFRKSQELQVFLDAIASLNSVLSEVIVKPS